MFTKSRDVSAIEEVMNLLVDIREQLCIRYRAQCVSLRMIIKSQNKLNKSTSQINR